MVDRVDQRVLQASQANPLVMRFGAFGDMVLLTVLIRHLHARFGRPVDIVSSGPWTEPLLAGQPGVGRLFLVRSRRTPYWLSLDQRRLVSWLRQRGPGPAWFCDMALGKDLLHRGGIAEEYICDSRCFKWSPEETFGDRFVRLGNESPLAFADLPSPPWSPPVEPVSRSARLFLTEAARAEADQWLAIRALSGKPLIFIHPGSRHMARRRMRSRAGVEKYWPEQRWAEVIRNVRDLRPDHTLLLTGTPGERQFNADIMARAGVSQISNIAAELTIPTLLPLLERAHSLISIDTGPAHAAAALGCRVVALFGTASPTLFRPGSATSRVAVLTGMVNGVQNILGITSDAVTAAWYDLIRSTEPAEQRVQPSIL